jgi:hypothetical protein
MTSDHTHSLLARLAEVGKSRTMFDLRYAVCESELTRSCGMRAAANLSVTGRLRRTYSAKRHLVGLVCAAVAGRVQLIFLLPGVR